MKCRVQPTGASRSCDKTRRRRKAGNPLAAIAFWREGRNGFFWANNNYDRWHTVDGSDSEQDDLGPVEVASLPAYEQVPDYDHVNSYSQRVIPNTRDLEDFARLWICGITTNLIAALPQDSSIDLSWGDVGNPDLHNPTIDIFLATDPDGSAGYLTNETAASQQIQSAASSYVGRVKPGYPVPLYSDLAHYVWPGSHYIWCGVSNGTGALTLTIKHGTNVLAQTKTYIQIVDIKQMYERWTVGENPGSAPASTAQIATNDLPAGTWPFRYVNPGNTTMPYILFVHGWNMETWEKDRFAEAAFKRLYWQGYQGRFGSFRWPTGYGFGSWKSVATDPDNFDNSESQAWKSGTGLLNLLSALNTQYPGHVYTFAHSMGNVVAGEALRLAGSNQVVNTYIAMQAAVPAHCYDQVADFRTILLVLDSGTPDRYANYPTNNGPCYFNASAGAGTYVNFFNANDWALAANHWQLDQDLKPDLLYSWNGTSFFAGGYPLYFPQDTYRIFAYCDEARCYALGAQASVGGAFNNNEVNLQTVWPPDTHPKGSYKDHVWHSAEFRSDNPSRSAFWKTILGNLGFKLK